MLPLILLRFLSIRFEKRRQELVREPESPYYTDDTQEAKAIVEDPDEYHSVGACRSRSNGISMDLLNFSVVKLISDGRS